MNPVRRRRLLWTAAVLVVLYAVIGFLVLPPIVRAQIVKRAAAELGRPVTLEKVRLNPFALSVTLENFDVGERSGAGSFLGWRRLYVNFGALASLTGDWVLSDIALDGFHAQVTVKPDGSFNFSDLLAKFAPPPTGPGAAAPPPSRPLRVGHLAVTGARVDFADHSRAQPFQTTVGPLSFDLTGFRTAGSRGAPYHFEAVTESGEKLAWTGTLSADPVQSAGEFSIENLQLPKYAPYYGTAVRADVASGTLSVRGRYAVDLDPKARALTLADGGLSLRNLKITERASGQPAVALAALDVTGLRGDGVALQGGADRVALSGGHLFVRRDKDGTLNWLAMLLPAGPAPAGARAAAPAAALPAVGLTVGEIALNDFAVDVTDLTTPRPAHLVLSRLQGALQNVSLADGAVMPLRFSFAWAPQGTVQGEGSVAIRPAVKVALNTKVADLAILPVSPYVEQFVNAPITGGTVSATADAQVALAGGQPNVSLAGDVKVEKFGMVDGAHAEPLAGFTALDVAGLKVSLTPRLNVAVADVKVAAPYARVVVAKDQSLNLAAVVKPGAAPAPVAAPPAPAAPAPKIEIAKVTIAGGDFSFTDRSLEPNVTMTVGQFGGTLAGLSADNPARADVDLKAMVDGVGPVTIAGKLDPLGANLFVDLTVGAQSVDLLPLSPYCGKYAGYELARGKLALDIKARVADRKVDMANVVTLNQFTWGAATNSPDATHLPVRLGVALLKDLDGKIVLDVPVDGRLDDPNFRIGKVVWRVIGNLLTKAAVSPFSLLGSMFGGGGEELSFQEFAPGAATPLPAEAAKLQTLIKALTNRPGLNLAIEGHYDAAADAYALKQQKLADLIRRKIWEARRAADANVAPPDQLVISPAEHDAMLKTLFDAKFPPGTAFGTPLPQAPAVAPPPPAPPPGLVKRVVNFLTRADARNRRAAEEEQARAAEELKQATASAVAAGLPPEVMTARLADTMEVTDNDLRALAAARAARVRDLLMTEGKIAADRLFLAQPATAAPAPARQGPRVFFDLQ